MRQRQDRSVGINAGVVVLVRASKAAGWLRSAWHVHFILPSNGRDGLVPGFSRVTLKVSHGITIGVDHSTLKGFESSRQEGRPAVKTRARARARARAKTTDSWRQSSRTHGCEEEGGSRDGGLISVDESMNVMRLVGSRAWRGQSSC